MKPAGDVAASPCEMVLCMEALLVSGLASRPSHLTGSFSVAWLALGKHSQNVPFPAPRRS